MGWVNRELVVDSGNFVPNNREGTEETTRDVVEGSEGVSGLEQDNAMCLSDAV